MNTKAQAQVVKLTGNRIEVEAVFSGKWYGSIITYTGGKGTRDFETHDLDGFLKDNNIVVESDKIVSW